MRIGVVTDSTCDLPVATLKRVGAMAAPLWVSVGEESYRDWRDLEPGTLYEWMHDQGLQLTVRSPDPEDFMAIYRNAFSHYDMVLSVHLSPRFSRTYDNARQAAERLGVRERVVLIDSGFAGAGLAEVVLEVAARIRDGGSAADAEAAAHTLRRQLFGVFSPTAGDWGSADRLLGKLRERRRIARGQRPLLGMQSGTMLPLGWSRQDGVARAMAQQLHRHFGSRPIAVAVACASADQADLARLREAVEAAGLNVLRGRVQLIGPALSTRLGTGAAALFGRPLEHG